VRQRHYSHAIGDLNLDGNQTLTDIATLVYVLLNGLDANADYDADGELGVSDVHALAGQVAGK